MNYLRPNLSYVVLNPLYSALTQSQYIDKQCCDWLNYLKRDEILYWRAGLARRKPDGLYFNYYYFIIFWETGLYCILWG